MDTRILDYIFSEWGVTGLVLIALAVLFFRLSADFAKLQTDLKQQLTRDLLNKRFAAYGNLWSKLRPLAVYEETPFTPEMIQGLSKCLSDWYFSPDGGLFLTIRAREFYFSLQDLLHTVETLPSWQCVSRSVRPKDIFHQFLNDLSDEIKKAGLQLKQLVKQLDQPESIEPKEWRDLCRLIAKKLESQASTSDPAFGEYIFVILQQVSSVLRTNLTFELHSRLEARVPRP